MIEIQRRIPRKLFLAVSGGVDSVAALDFLASNHDVTIAHVNHNEGNSDEGEEFVRSLAFRYAVPMKTHYLSGDKPSRLSWEEYWRVERYKFFHSLDMPVVTCHHLDDCVETWIWSSLHGQGKIIPYSNQNVVRPFRLTKKCEFRSWAKRRNLTWLEDESNEDLSLTRNYIRKVMMPHVLRVNPGIQKTIYKKIKEL